MVCVNRLSINFSKTNFMIIKSQEKKKDQVNINIESADGTINVHRSSSSIWRTVCFLFRACPILRWNLSHDHDRCFYYLLAVILTRQARLRAIICASFNYF